MALAGYEPMPAPHMPRTRAVEFGWNPPFLGLNTLLFSRSLSCQTRNAGAVLIGAQLRCGVGSDRTTGYRGRRRRGIAAPGDWPEDPGFDS